MFFSNTVLVSYEDGIECVAYLHTIKIAKIVQTIAKSLKERLDII